MDAPDPHGLDDWKPRPDPTSLTTQQLDREIGALRELLEAKLTGMESTLRMRLDGNDKALLLLQSLADKIPTEVDTKLAALHNLYEEKFRSIQMQFTERGTRNEQTARSAKEAVDAALVSAKEAVAKSESMTNKQIEQQGALLSAMRDALSEQLDELKERVTRNEGQDRGQISATSTRHSDRTFMVAASAVLISLVFGAIGAISILR